MSNKMLTMPNFQLFDDPNSGRLAKFIGYFDQVVILLAVAAQCIESLPVIRRSESEDAFIVGSLRYYILVFNSLVSGF